MPWFWSAFEGGAGCEEADQGASTVASAEGL